MITLLTLLPILGGLLVLVFGRTREMARLIAALFGFTGLILSLLFWYALDPNLPGMQFTQYHVWAPSLGIEYHVGADGLAVLLLVLSALLVVFSLMASWANEKLGRGYFALVLFLEAGLFGTFTALNFVH